MFRVLPTARINDSVSKDWQLTPVQIKERRDQYGNNHIIDTPRHRWIEITIATLLDPMIWFLLLASFLFAILAKYSESIVLLLAIIPIGGMDAFLHWRTNVTTRALNTQLITYARVLRDGKEYMIAAQELVPGDLMLVRASEYFSADGILVDAVNAQVDESSLTGETFPVSKHKLPALPVGQSEPLINYEYWGFVGTRLLTGQALIRVVYTGKETLYGEIIESILRTHYEKTPLQKSIANLVIALLGIAIAFCILLAVIRLAQGFGLIDALLSTTTLAVAALPDEFPMVLTFYLGVGVYRLAKQHALVRRGVSVENIGRVNCICTDKTGTVTQGHFRIAKYIPEVISENELLSFAALASRSESGDPLDIAILNAINPKDRTMNVCVRTFPFTEEAKRETSVYEVDQRYLLVTKGAPEIICDLCALSQNKREEWLRHVERLSAQGYKVIACAREYMHQIPEVAPTNQDYEFLGLLAFEDPPRPEVVTAIDYCQKNHIQVVMITGDHPETAKKIANEINLGDGIPYVINAIEAEVLLEKHGVSFLSKIDVIARALPVQKLNFVKAYQQLGDIVAVTGDGVNDVPALKEADVGIAMGERGTQSAREVADIVLLDDNFGSIVNAIKEGKQLFKNLQLSFKYLLMVHAPYVFSATIIPLLGFPLLYYPIHIVWIELFIHPTCMLAFQASPNSYDTFSQSADREHVKFFSRFDWLGIFTLSLYTTLLVVLTYFVSLYLQQGEMSARANAFTAVGLTHIALTIGLTKLKSLTSYVIVIVSLLMLLFLVQIPPIAHYFAMNPPLAATWLALTGFSTITGLLALRFR